METDKAVMDVESAYEGTILEWLAAAEDVLPIGAEVARMEVAGPVEEEPAPKADSTQEPPARANIPPRTRAYAKEKGLTEEQLARLAAGSVKLMPEDIDAFLAGASDKPYDEKPIPPKQRVLNSRMHRGGQLVVPGTISVAVNWEPIEAKRAELKAKGGDFQPSAFTMFGYAVARAVKDHPALKTSVVGEDTYRTYKQLSLGIAVSLPGDELVLAVVDGADELSWVDFAKKAREQIESARAGKDQANESVTLSLTNMQSFGLRDAVPVVVPPSVATLFIGEIYGAPVEVGGSLKIRRTVNMALTFDHRAMNGVGAAHFINAVKKNVEAIASLLD